MDDTVTTTTIALHNTKNELMMLALTRTGSKRQGNEGDDWDMEGA